ncbi:MAG TPA: glycosyltransferase family 39 protein [Vicinamibacterales bacterium]
MRPWLPAAVIAAAAAPVYFWQLASVPAFGGDEARFAIHAHEIALTGRDLDGTSFPVLFRIHEYSFWYQPGLFYAIAAVLKLAPLNEWTARIPMVVFGLANIALIYFVARSLLGSARYSVFASIGLAVTPAHLIFSRQALDYMLPVTLALAWLGCLLAVLERAGMRLAAASGALLGVMVYTHFSAWTMAPLYFVLSVAALWLSDRRRAILPFAAGCAVVLLPLALWLARHPDFFAQMTAHYGLYDSQRYNPLQGAREIVNWNGIETRIAVYWDYYNPGFLFMSGGAGMTAATRRAGVFLLAFAVFIPCGLAYLWQRRRLPAAWIVLVGFFTPPIAVSMIGSRYLVQRELLIVPFGVLVATFGVALLMQHPSRWLRGAAIALLVSMPLQFIVFYRDYLGDYVTRSAIWFDPGSFKQTSEYVAAKDSAAIPEVWISDALDDAVVHWPYQMRKRQRNDLLQKSHYFAADRYDVNSIPAGSLLLLQHNDVNLPRLIGEGRCCEVESYINGADGNRSVVVLVKR